MADPRARLTKIRDGLTPGEWARTGGMAGSIIGLHVLGWGMLAAAVGNVYAGPSPPVPEIDPGALTSGLTLLAGGVLIVTGRRVRK